MRWLALLCLIGITRAATAEPGPKPREARLDGDGDLLTDGALVRLGTKRFRDLNATNVAVSPDGKSAVCWDSVGVRIWDLADGKLRRTWHVPTAHLIRNVSPDGRFAVITHDDNLEVWNTVDDRAVARRATGPWEFTHRLVVSPDGNTVACTDRVNRKGIWVWDVRADRTRILGEHEHDIHGVSLFGDGRRLLAWTRFGETTCWDVKEGRQLWRAQSYDEPKGSGDGRYVIVSPISPTGLQVEVLDAETGKRADDLRVPAIGYLYSILAFSHDGGLLVGRHSRLGPVIWDMKGARTTRDLGDARVQGMAFTPDGKSLVTVGRSIEIWDAHSNKESGGARAKDGHTETTQRLTWSADGQSLASMVGSFGAQYLWDAKTGRLRYFQPAARSGFVNLVTASRDPGRWLTVESLEPEHPHVRFVARDSRTGESRGPAALTVKKDWSFLDAAIESDLSQSMRLVVRSQQGDQQTLSVRDVSWRDGQITTRASFPFVGKYPLSVSPNGRFLHLSGRVYDLDRLADEPPLKPVGGRTAEYGCHDDAAGFLLGTHLQRPPDPKTGRTGGVCDVAIYERWSGTLVRHIVTGDPWPFALSPDGLMVAALAPEGIRVWDIRSGKEIRRHAVTTPGVHRKGNSGTALAFSPDSHRLAVGHWDGTIVIWDASRSQAKALALTAAELDRLWADLASPEGKTGWDAAFRLADSPAESSRYLVERVTPVKELSVTDADRLLADLESPAFRTRELAAKRAKDWGDPARVIIEAALKRKPGADLRQRLELLATALSWAHPPIPDDLRRLRAITVLERIGTKEARAKIDELAEGLAESRVTVEAKRARQRLAERTAPRE